MPYNRDMRHNRRRRIESSSSGKSTQLLSLALFIMLLAFFIVLNALSTFDENKVEPILGNLEKTFSTTNSDIAQRRPSVRPSDSSEEFSGEGKASTINRLKDLFRGRLSQIEITENTEKGIMMVEVPYQDFSTATLIVGQTADILDVEEVPFLPTLVSLLKTAQDGNIYRMDILLQTDEDPLDLKQNAPDRFRTARDNVGRLSRRLEDAGLSPYHLSIGLREGQENTLNLIFTPYEALNILENRAEDAANE